MQIRKFSQYLVESEKEVYFTFGRMNPPTVGHGKVFDTISKKSGKNDYKIFLSQVSNPKKDPLSYSDKVKHIRKMFPKHGRNVIINKNIKSVNYDIDTYKKKIYIYGIAMTQDEKDEVIKEAKEILDVEDVIASIILVSDLRIKKD